MNTDEKFNYYSDRMHELNPDRVKRFEHCMSDMLASGCSTHLVWNYAERELKAEMNKGVKSENICLRCEKGKLELHWGGSYYWYICPQCGNTALYYLENGKERETVSIVREEVNNS